MNWIVEFFKTVKDMTIKKIIIVFICIYPLFGVVYFKNELSLMFSQTKDLIVIENPTKIIIEANKIKDNFKASVVSIWIYQPSGDKKAFKERIHYTGDSRNLFFNLDRVELIHHPQLLSSLTNNKYVKVSSKSKYELSKLVDAYDGIEVIYVIPLKNAYGLIFSEIVVAFDKELNENQLNKLIASSELIRITM